MTLRALIVQHRALLATGTLLGLLGAAATLAQPLVIGEVIKAVAADETLLWPVLLAAALFAADAALAAAHAYVIGRTGEDVVHQLRRTLTGRLLRARLRELDRWVEGDLFTRMVADTGLARIAVSNALAQMITSGFMAIGGIVLMSWIDLPLLGATLVCLGAAAAVALGIARKVRGAAVANHQDTAAFGSALMRAVQAAAVVKTSRAEQRETDTITAASATARRSGIRVSALQALMTPAMNVGTQVALTVILTWGMARVTTGGLAAADLTAFMMYLFYLVSPLVLLFLSISQFQQGRAALGRVMELDRLEQEETVAARREATALAPGASATGVVFQDVDFTYPGADHRVLDGVSFRIPDRGLTAITGPSGAGKTTVFQLLTRLRIADAGTVHIDGTDIATMPLDQLRSLIGYVDQAHTLMRGTIRDNLVYAHPDATDPEIRAALEQAQLADVVDRLPQGLDTELGERGTGLSGGQQQRLAVARALLTRPRILLLDEATANLDAAAEHTLLETVVRIAEDRAVVAIAHRPTTIRAAAAQLAIDGGRVHEITKEGVA
ncbi:ABC transporter ATP-binding protein [Streptomyces sp. NPDC052236]|uniref:ABC transporter ATP-binding protein n=1 Tax=Streptomyces sp. NPDC052236 TaxID=3365686 RepID=UPI0037D6CF9E